MSGEEKGGGRGKEKRLQLSTSSGEVAQIERGEKTGSCHGSLKLPTETMTFLVQPQEEEYISQ